MSLFARGSKTAARWGGKEEGSFRRRFGGENGDEENNSFAGRRGEGIPYSRKTFSKKGEEAAGCFEKRDSCKRGRAGARLGEAPL